MPLLIGGNIANVERVKITTVPATGTGVTHVFETATSCTFTPAVSSGTEVEQRIKNTLYGMIKTDDKLKGYDIDLEDQRLIVEIFALIDGGTLTTETGAWTKYQSPAAGSAVTRTPFTLELYTSDRDTDGEANEYNVWKFTACKGTPVGGSASDGAFSALKYSIQSRPATGEHALEITRVTELPTVS